MSLACFGVQPRAPGAVLAGQLDAKPKPVIVLVRTCSSTSTLSRTGRILYTRGRPRRSHRCSPYSKRWRNRSRRGRLESDPADPWRWSRPCWAGMSGPVHNRQPAAGSRSGSQVRPRRRAVSLGETHKVDRSRQPTALLAAPDVHAPSLKAGHHVARRTAAPTCCCLELLLKQARSRCRRPQASAAEAAPSSSGGLEGVGVGGAGDWDGQGAPRSFEEADVGATRWKVSWPAPEVVK